jgi:hypothetical protein
MKPCIFRTKESKTYHKEEFYPDDRLVVRGEAID